MFKFITVCFIFQCPFTSSTFQRLHSPLSLAFIVQLISLSFLSIQLLCTFVFNVCSKNTYNIPFEFILPFFHIRPLPSFILMCSPRSTTVRTFFPVNSISLYIIATDSTSYLHQTFRQRSIVMCSWTTCWAYSTCLFLIFPFYCSHCLNYITLFLCYFLSHL